MRMAIHRSSLLLFLERFAFALLCLVPPLLAISRAGADIVVCLIGAAFLTHSLLQKDWRWLKESAFWALGSLWLYLIATSLLTDHIASSLSTALCWGRLLIFTAAMYSWLLATPERLRKISYFNLFIMAAVMLDGYWQYATGTSLSGRPMMGFRLTGPISHPVIGAYLLKVGLPVIGLAVYQALKENNRRWLFGVMVFCLLLVTLVILSGERTSAILMLIAIAVIGSILFLRQPRLRRSVLLGGSVMTVLLLLLFDTQRIVEDRSQTTLRHLSHFRSTPYGQLYSEAYMLWKKHPILGIGAGEFRYLCQSVMADLGNSYCDIHPHNTYLEWLTEGGIIGLILFLLSMTLLIRIFLRNASFGGLECVPAAFSVGTFIVLLFPFAVTQSMFNNWAGISFWYSFAFAISLSRIITPQNT